MSESTRLSTATTANSTATAEAAVTVDAADAAAVDIESIENAIEDDTALNSTAADRTVLGGTTPDHTTLSSTTPDHTTLSSTTPDHTTLSSTTSGSTPLDFALFDSAIGTCAIAWAGEAVIRFQLPESNPAETRARIARRRIGRAGDQVRETTPPSVIAEAIAGIRAHLAGELDDLRWIPVDTSGIPAFHRRVYDVTRAIDPGRVLGYGQIAARIGPPGSAQAVGQALGRNPIPLIIPCHRVVAADNALTGFSAPGGIHTKQRLLEIERTPGFGEPTLF